MREIKRGDVYYVNLGDVVGSEQGGKRPCLVVQNDVGNKYAPTTIVVPMTSRRTKTSLPTHVEYTLPNGIQNTILFEQLRTVDKSRLERYIGYVPADGWIDALKISIGG